MDETPTMPTPVEERKTPSFFARYKFTIISLCIILIALVPLVILAQNSKKAPQPTIAQNTVSPTPTPVPLTEQNAEPTLSATEQQIQNAIDQSNQDINQANQVDSSQDSVAGL